MSGFIRAQIMDTFEMASFTDEDILRTSGAADQRAVHKELSSIGDLLTKEGWR